MTECPARWLLLALVLLAGAVGCRGTDGPGPGPIGELRERLEGAEAPERFDLAYSSAGTQVLDCFLPNPQFSVAVDRRSGILRVTTPGSGAQAVALLVAGDAYLRRTLFAPGALGAEWLRVAAGANSATKEQLSRELGSGLAGYLLAPGLPPNGVETAVAVLDVATEVRALGEQDVGGRRLDRYQVILDADRLAARADSSQAGARALPTGSPRVDVWFDADGDVTRLAVTIGTDPAAGEAALEGWIIDYREARGGIDEAAPTAVVDVSQIDETKLESAASGSCELGPRATE